MVLSSFFNSVKTMSQLKQLKQLSILLNLGILIVRFHILKLNFPLKNYLSTVMLSSVPFLFATILIYACIKELRNLHGKCLMSYCFGLTLLYLSLGLIQLYHGELAETKWLCETTGYIAYTSVLVCFLWLNVMCYDIWSTFR
jgi:hypothetical protein